MKKLLQYISALLGMALFITLLAVVVLIFNNNENIVTEQETKQVQESNDILANPMSGFSQLTPEEQETYIRICNEIDSLNDSFYLTGNTVSEDQFNKIMTFILKDHPDYFFIPTYSYMKNPDNIVESVQLTFSDTPENIAQKQFEVETWKNNVLSGITPDMTNYQKVKYIHDYLIDNTTYDLTAPNNQNILSVIEENRTVCAGYAKAFQYLLNKAGIFATYVTGTADVGMHAWNLIEVDGEYGWVDVTWDDPGFIGNDIPEGIRSYTYFGLSTDEMNKTHEMDTTFEPLNSYPIPTFNYFNQEALYYNLDDPGSYDSIIQKLLEAKLNGNTSFEIMLSNNDQVIDFLSYLSTDPILFDNSISYLYDESHPIITFLL